MGNRNGGMSDRFNDYAEHLLSNNLNWIAAEPVISSDVLAKTFREMYDLGWHECYDESVRNTAKRQ